MIWVDTPESGYAVKRPAGVSPGMTIYLRIVECATGAESLARVEAPGSRGSPSSSWKWTATAAPPAFR